MRDLPPLNALRAFEVAGRHLNFCAAADELGLTQGAVAQHVRALEGHLALKLFTRLPKGLAFTTIGRGYHARVAAAFADLQQATQVLRPEPDTVLISVTPSFAAKWLIPALPAFSAQHPEIDLRIMATEKISGFRGDGIDLAVRQTRPPFGAALDAVCLFRQKIIAVASPHLLQGLSLPAGAEALSRLPKLHDAHDLWPAFLQNMQAQDHSGRGLRLSQTALAIDAALSAQGVALVASFLVERDLALGHLRQVTAHSMDGTQDFYLLAERAPARRPATTIVRQWLLSQAGTGD
jgi:LysR family glycine cleavage system transcriptional activator